MSELAAKVEKGMHTHSLRERQRLPFCTSPKALARMLYFSYGMKKRDILLYFEKHLLINLILWRGGAKEAGNIRCVVHCDGTG